jgi:DNA processing protein
VKPAGGAPDRAETAALLALLAAPGLSDARVLELLEQCGTARAAFAVLERTCGSEVVTAAHSPAVRRRVLRALRIIEDDDLRTISFSDPAYPELLRVVLGPAAPPVLFARGDPGVFAQTGIAVVGCRGATEYGLDIAERIGGAVARAGGCLVSGLARGVDAAAHAAALDAGGSTIAVLGCGVDVYYPPQNMQLQDRIAECGLLLSEFLPGEAPRKYRFPHRNRIIAALSAAVVVVEAGEKSGAIRTAEHAMAAGIATYAVPSALDRPNMQGILGLYRDGVPPFTGVDDLLESVGMAPIGPIREQRAEPLPTGLHARVLAALGEDPLHVDRIAAAAAAPVTETLVALLELELDGRIRQHSGARFVRPRSGRPAATRHATV